MSSTKSSIAVNIEPKNPSDGELPEIVLNKELFYKANGIFVF